MHLIGFILAIVILVFIFKLIISVIESNSEDRIGTTHSYNKTKTYYEENFADEYYTMLIASREVDTSNSYLNKIKELSKSIDDLNSVYCNVTLSDSDAIEYKDKFLNFSIAVNEGYAQYSYSSHLSLAAFLPEDSSTIVSTDDFLKKARMEIYELCENLSEQINDSLSDNIISENEMKSISETKEKIMFYFDTIETSQIEAKSEAKAIKNK